MFQLSADARAQINKHALAEFPKECCGLIADGIYFPSINAADKPENDFVIPGALQVQIRATGHKIEAVVHSHCNGQLFPSEADMKGQMTTKLPWILVATDGQTVTAPEMWGDDVEIPVLIGRQFLHGIRDCYSLVRDVYRLGKEGMKVRGIDWPLESIVLPDFARTDGWWGDKKVVNQTLYLDNFEKVGFAVITREQVRAGDSFLMKFLAQTPNHAGVLLADGTILHHTPLRLSGRVPAGMWAHAADIWVRYVGPK